MGIVILTFIRKCVGPVYKSISYSSIGRYRILHKLNKIYDKFINLTVGP